MGFRFRVSKRPDFQARLGKYASEREVIEGILLPIGFETERLAKRGAPVDTGRLRASIGTASRSGGSASSESVASPSEPFSVAVGSGVLYAVAVHEGHPTKAGFLRDAAREAMMKAQSIGRTFGKRP